VSFFRIKRSLDELIFFAENLWCFNERMRMRSWLTCEICRGACGVVLMIAIGCRSADRGYVAPEEPMPPNTVLMSTMMRELSDTPGFTDAMLAQLGGNGKNGPALMTPALVKRLRQLILGKDWQGLDRFPGWTMQAINPTVKIADRVVAKNPSAADLATQPTGARTSDVSSQQMKEYVDFGSYPLEKAERVSLDKPSTLPGFTTEGQVSNLGAGVVRGDGANPRLAPMHAESQRMADVLNRLSLNAMNGAMPLTAEIGDRMATTPAQMVQVLMDTGHTVVVSDARYFANFGHFHYKGQEVMVPFWVDSQIAIPGRIVRCWFR
jgi:hypothetical protein